MFDQAERASLERPPIGSVMTSASSPLRVVVVNGFDDSNVGGAAITLATCDIGRDLSPSTELSLVTVDSTPDLRFNSVAQPDLRVLAPPFDVRASRARRYGAFLRSVAGLLVPGLLGRPNPTVAALRDADVVISKGGFVYRERTGLGSLLAGWFTMWPYMFARRCGATAVAYSASVGPFVTARSRRLSRFALRGSEVVCPRDDDSLHRLESDLRLGEQVLQMPDCVLGLLDDERAVAPPVAREPGRVVVVPRQVPAAAWPGFVERVREVIDAVSATSVEFVLQADDDRAAAQRLAEAIGRPDVAVLSHATPLDCTAAFSQAQLVVTGRLHGAILSLLTRTPVVMIEIPDEQGKSGPVLGDLGLGWVMVDADAAPGASADVVTRLMSMDFANEVDPALRRTADQVRSVRAEVVRRLEKAVGARPR